MRGRRARRADVLAPAHGHRHTSGTPPRRTGCIGNWRRKWLVPCEVLPPVTLEDRYYW